MSCNKRIRIKPTKALMLVISALVFCSYPSQSAWSPDGGLAGQLYEEGDWAGARVEAWRGAADETDAHWTESIAALATLQLEPVDEVANALIAQALKDDRLLASQRAWIAYEYGRIQWRAGHPEEAFTTLRFGFTLADDVELFLQIAHTMDLLLTAHPNVAEWHQSDPVLNQLRTTLILVTPAIRATAGMQAPLQSGRSPFAWPAVALIQFYRHQIGPAIGERCSMHPSCSTYAREAVRTQGILGVPMTADRLIRETDHVQYRINPVLIDGHERYHDPVSDHVGWRGHH